MKHVSILGDSISTYENFIPANYKLYYTKEVLAKNGMTSVYDMWWAKVNQYLHAYLCVNNSYSGSKVSGEKFPSANTSYRVSYLHNPHTKPDIILVYIGFNDFGYGIPIVRYPLHASTDMRNFTDSYHHMLNGIRKNYPAASIICGTLLRGYVKVDPSTSFPEYHMGHHLHEYNQIIRSTAKINHCKLADLASLNICYESLDGVHPTKAGHLTIAQAWINCLKKMNL